MLPVLIVGAGPTGLILALWLKKKGVDFRIVDKAPAPGLSSRALAIQARTLEFYRQLGIDEDIVRAGIRAMDFKLWRRGKFVASAPLGAMGEGTSPFPYLLFLSQDVHEGMLNEALAKVGVQIERNVELIALEQNAREATVTLRGPSGEEVLKVQYLCGCDGAHSAVRHLLGAEFPGAPYEQVFFVADVEATGPMAQGGIQISLGTEGFCIVMPIEKRGTIRLTGIVPPESQRKEKIRYEDVAASVAENTGLKVAKVNWFSSYRVHHRMAEHFRKGRVFLAGDAGHIHSPAGGQGMNTGIGDAVNLAWKLTEVLQGRAKDAILDTYDSERTAFAKQLLSTTDQAFRLVASRSTIGTLWRMYVMPRVFATIIRFPTSLRFMFRLISQTRIEYRASVLSQGSGEGEIRAGDRLPWVRFGKSDNYAPLKSLSWQVHVYGRAEEGFAATVRELSLPLHVFEWNEEARAKRIPENAAYLVRPDGYLGFVSESQAVSELRRYFALNLVAG